MTEPPAARAGQEFLARFFHDLATPLSAVSLHLDGADRRVRRGADPSESLAIAREELARAFDLFERGREILLAKPAPAESLSFDDLVADAVAAAGGNSRIRLEGHTRGRVEGDRAALARAMAELLSNALDAAEGSAIQVSCEKNGEKLRVRIVNPGRLPADNPETLFSPRAAGKGKKWGMGLAQARLDAASAGGTVHLEQSGDDVTATLEIPEESA